MKRFSGHHVSLDSVCRLCLCSGCRLADVFEENVMEACVLKDLIEDLLSRKVVKDVMSPWKVCCNCKKKLTEFNYFKRSCLENQDVFENYVNQRRFVKVRCKIRGGDIAKNKVICNAVRLDVSNSDVECRRVELCKPNGCSTNSEVVPVNARDLRSDDDTMVVDSGSQDEDEDVKVAAEAATSRTSEGRAVGGKIGGVERGENSVLLDCSEQDDVYYEEVTTQEDDTALEYEDTLEEICIDNILPYSEESIVEGGNVSAEDRTQVASARLQPCPIGVPSEPRCSPVVIHEDILRNIECMESATLTCREKGTPRTYPGKAAKDKSTPIVGYVAVPAQRPAAPRVIGAGSETGKPPAAHENEGGELKDAIVSLERKLVEHMRKEMKQLHVLEEAIASLSVRRMGGVTPREDFSEIEHIPAFPLETLEEMESFQNEIASSPKFRRYMVQFLKDRSSGLVFRGSSQKEVTVALNKTVYSCLALVMTNQMAVMFCMKGKTKQKVGFELAYPKLVSLLFDVVKEKNMDGPDVDLISVKRSIGEWFRLARLRIHGSRPVKQSTQVQIYLDPNYM